VVDNNGNRYAPTYFRRAKGLVKAGRARWLGENDDYSIICLTTGPAQIEEDNLMNIDFENRRFDNDGNEIFDGAKACDLPPVGCDDSAPVLAEGKLSVEYILNQMEKIHKDSAYIFDALAKVAVDHGESSGAHRIVEAREETNRKMLEIYSKMYDDLSSKKSPGYHDVQMSKIDSAQLETMLKFATTAMENSDDFAESFGHSFGDALKHLIARKGK